MIRVTLVGPSLDILGGQAVQAQRLLKRLQGLPDLKVSFLPVNPRLPGPLCLLQRVKYLRTVATSIAYAIRLIPSVLCTDILVAFSAGYWSFLLAPVPAILLGRLLGRKVILYYHTGEAEDHLRRHGIFAIPLMRLAHRIIVPSPYLIEVFDHYGLTSTSIPNFVELEHLPFRKRGVPSPRFMSNRNFETLYNLPCTLQTFATIQRSYPEASLVMVGSGSQERSLRRITQSLGLKNISFVGRVPPEHMGAAYDKAEIYLNSPDIDNAPLSIIEAFACGLPIVSTNAGGIPFIVTNEVNGLLVERNDPAAMATAALRLLREPGLADRLTSAARAEALTRYTWEAVGEEWLKVYQELMSQDESSRGVEKQRGG